MVVVIVRSWSDLPVDILNTIVESLHYADQIRFRLVCKSWRFNANPIKHAGKLPWVMSINENYDERYNSSSKGLFYLYDPSQKKRYTRHNSMLSGATMHASKHGWLLLSPSIPHSSALIFYTPFTHKIIQLPELHKMDGCRKATFSTAPTSSDCLIFALTVQSKKLCVSTCGPGDDEWKNHWFDGDHGQIDSLAFVGGVLYCLFSECVMASFKVEQEQWRIHPHPSPMTNNVTNFLVDHQLIESRDNNLLATCARVETAEQVFRYDQADTRWLKVEDLGDRMLFLGITSMLVPAGEEASQLANTIHRARHMSVFGGLGSATCFSYHFIEPHKRLVKTYNWIDKLAHSKKSWIQPLQHT